jgi:hypothetical protein
MTSVAIIEQLLGITLLSEKADQVKGIKQGPPKMLSPRKNLESRLWAMPIKRIEEQIESRLNADKNCG